MSYPGGRNCHKESCRLSIINASGASDWTMQPKPIRKTLKDPEHPYTEVVMNEQMHT